MKKLVGINSLRFVAITMVVAYHLFRDFLPGGFIAVEIFFCVSGFLIISKLIQPGEKQGYGQFILGRLRRLYPALAACVLLTLVASIFVAPDIATGAKVNSATALTFTTNIAELITGGSYENTFLPNLFEHTWFLALLFQLYLLIPLIFKLYENIFQTRRTATKMFGITLLLLAIASAFLMAMYGAIFELPDRAYFALDSHMAAFCLGGAFAVYNYFQPRSPRAKKRFSSLAMFASLGGFIVLAFATHFDSPLAFCIGLPLADLLALLLVVYVVKLQKNIHVRRKTWTIVRFMEGIGALSYGIYLYHWPLYILLPQFLSPDTAVWGYALINILLSIVLAYASFELLDVRSWRRKFNRLKRPMRFALSALVVMVLAATVVAWLRAPQTSSIAKQLNAAAKSETEIVSETKAIDFISANEIYDKTKLVLTTELQLAQESKPAVMPSKSIAAPNANAARVLVIGDSVTLGAKEAIESTIAQSFVDAKESRGIETATRILADYSATGKLPKTIVISLATNERNITEKLLKDITDVAGKGHNFILVTAYAGPLQPRDKQNKVLKEYANKHGNVYIADWWEVSHNNWSLMYADHIHLNPEGRITYANLLKNVLKGIR